MTQTLRKSAANKINSSTRNCSRPTIRQTSVNYFSIVSSPTINGNDVQKDLPVGANAAANTGLEMMINADENFIVFDDSIKLLGRTNDDRSKT